ncbi:hypothetical protein BH11BAC3_BH11BAC3_27900 [soil metagenome]
MLLLLSAGSTVNAQLLQKVKVVAINSFQVSKYEITNQQYAIFLNRKQIAADAIVNKKQLINIGNKDLQIEFVNKYWQAKAGKENYPMVMVSYYGALEYCKWIGAKLPTEIQWKYAASGGKRSKHFMYAGSNQLDEVGWYKNNSQQQSHAVGGKQPNELGIYDMSGNAWEWCLNDSLKTDSGFCVHMGGSWYAGEQPASINAHYGNHPTHFSNSVGFRVVFPIDKVINAKAYKGKPWNNQPQQIPGKIQCEWYDMGGEGIAYHDADSINSGSGRLNPADGTFLNEFRINEAVDISYTKSREIDNNPHNKVEPLMDQLYAGWTEPGEWINYTVDVTKSGKYSIGIMHTASGDGSIELLLDGKPFTGELIIPSTRTDNETVAWRQWHHWNRIDHLTTVHLTKGKHLLTLKTITNGNMNYDYINFSLEK